MNPEFPVLIPPTDLVMKRKLGLKLQEYEKRKAGKGYQWEKLNEAQALFIYPQYRDVSVKIIVLEKVLSSTEPIDTKILFESIIPPICSENDFKGPCIVIEEYLTGKRDLKVHEPPATD